MDAAPRSRVRLPASAPGYANAVTEPVATPPSKSTPTTTAGPAGAGQSGIGGLVGRVLGRLDRYQRAHPWLGFPFAVFKKFGDDQAGNLAALIAYYGFFSLFPLLLVLFTVLGFVLSGDTALQQKVLHSTLAQFPVIGDQIHDNVTGLKGSGIGLAIGLAGLVWAGMGAMQAAQNAMNGVWNVPIKSRPNFIFSRLRGLMMLAVIGLGVILTTVLASVASFGGGHGPVIAVGGLALTLVVDFGLFLLTFKVLTDVTLRWGQLVPGAAVAAVAWAALQGFGGYYVGHQLKGASATYGLFGLVIGLLSWLYLQAQLTLLAAEVNVVRERRLWPRGLQSEHLTEADQRALQQYAGVEERLPVEEITVELRDQPDPPDRALARTSP